MQEPEQSPASSRDDVCFAAHLLSNGRYAALLSENGGGYSALDGYALTRWIPDPTCDVAGVHLYVRDVETGAFHTPAGGPVPGPGGHTFRCAGGSAEFRSATDGIECATSVVVSRAHDVELRRLTMRNAGAGPRVVEVTTFAELALATPAADAAHPAFSRLFVQTACDATHGALLAWRRSRSAEDRQLWVLHRLLCEDAEDAAQYETDRARFVGRGRSARNPAALCCAGPLSGTTGNVLDPVFAMRRVVTIEPGASATLVAILGAAESRELALHTVELLPHVAAAQAAFDDASPAPRDGVAALGLPQPWRELIRIEHAAPRARTIAAPASIEPRRGASPASSAPAREAERLRFFNGWGGFSADGAEYVIRMPPDGGVPRRPPLPWVNVLANAHAGCIVSESGATHTWAANSRENRITPWFNDPVTDPHGEALYIRDDESGAVWSPTPGPIPGSGSYEVRHGLGSTRFLHDGNGLDHDTCIFVPASMPARVARVRLVNRTAAPRRLTLFAYAQLVLGGHEADTRGRVRTWHAADPGALMARNDDRGEFSRRVAFAAVAAAGPGPVSWTTDRRVFIGGRGRIDAPAAVCGSGAVRREPLDGWTGAGRDPCFALSYSVELAPGGETTCAFVLGEAAGAEEAAAVVRSLAAPEAIDVALDTVRDQWRRRAGAVRIETPVPALDIMVNGWLAYQNLSCRMWARSAFYQSGGAFGFRDQLQDASALVYIDPALTRDQILLHAAHQFVEGDVLHWWHPPLSRGIRTRFSDDLLWLPYITAFYIARTGDHAILDEHVRWLYAPPLEPGSDEEFVTPEDPGLGGSLYEHCCRAIDRSLTCGPHGLPIIGVGDWNDGMNRVGREGRGESVWLGFFLFTILDELLPICAARGDAGRVAAYRSYHERLAHVLNDAGWDGAWYRRAFYDSGAPIGSADSDECRIDALAQAWAVMSRAAPATRAAQALDSMEEYLVDEDAGLIRLLTPPFDRTPNDPGYIKGYLPGVRENGGQYTHGVLWAVRALAELGRNDRAARLLEMLSPVTRGGTPQNAARYRVEPYVIAADVYGVEPHVGRGGWTWYTGSAGWMYRIALESVLGVDLHAGAELRLRPCIPDEWPGFRVTLRRPDNTVCDIVVERGAHTCIALDGEPGRVTGGALTVPLPGDGARHDVRAVLGPDYRISYAPRV